MARHIGHVRFHGFFQPQSMITIVYPNWDTMLVSTSNRWLGRFWGHNDSKVTIKGVMFDGHGSPKIQSSKIRGIFRDASKKFLLNNLTQKLKRWEFGLIAQGGSNAKVEDRRMTPQKLIELRSKSPHLSLFGSFDNASYININGRIKICDATATNYKSIRLVENSVICNEEHEEHPALEFVEIIRTDPFIRDEQNITYLADPDELERIREIEDQASELKKAQKAAKRKAKTAGAEADAKIEKDHIENEKALLAQANSDQDIRIATQQLHSFYAIPANTVFEHSFQIDNSTDVELGLILRILQSEFAASTIGGHGARGAGGFHKSFGYNVTIGGEHAGVIYQSGDITLLDGDILIEALATYQDEIASVPNGGFFIPEAPETKKAKEPAAE